MNDALRLGDAPMALRMGLVLHAHVNCVKGLDP